MDQEDEETKAGPENAPRQKREKNPPPLTPYAELTPGQRSRMKRKRSPRLDVWKELQRLNFNPVHNLIDLASDPHVSDKVKSDINQELLGYCCAKKRPEIKLAEDAVNPLAELMTAIAGQPRPRPATASVVVDDEGDDEGED